MADAACLRVLLLTHGVQTVFSPTLTRASPTLTLSVIKRAGSSFGGSITPTPSHGGASPRTASQRCEPALADSATVKGRGLRLAAP